MSNAVPLVEYLDTILPFNSTFDSLETISKYPHYQAVMDWHTAELKRFAEEVKDFDLMTLDKPEGSYTNVRHLRLEELVGDVIDTILARYVGEESNTTP